jgi:hypothetical protein
MLPLGAASGMESRPDMFLSAGAIKLCKLEAFSPLKVFRKVVKHVRIVTKTLNAKLALETVCFVRHQIRRLSKTRVSSQRPKVR